MTDFQPTRFWDLVEISNCCVQALAEKLEALSTTELQEFQCEEAKLDMNPKGKGRLLAC